MTLYTIYAKAEPVSRYFLSHHIQSFSRFPCKWRTSDLQTENAGKERL